MKSRAYLWALSEFYLVTVVSQNDRGGGITSFSVYASALYFAPAFILDHVIFHRAHSRRHVVRHKVDFSEVSP